MVNTRSSKRNAQPANAASKNAKRKAPKSRKAPRPSAATKKRRRQLNVSDDESTTVGINSGSRSSNENPLILVTPRDNYFNAKTWWMVDLSPIEDTSLQGASALVKRCMRTHSWNETKARKVLAAYRQFLLLKKIHEDWNADILSPCHLVDEMWLCHISDVVNYCHDMMLLCGHVVGHNPDALNIEAKRKRDHDTRVCLTEEFGEYDKEVWDYSPNAAAARAINDRSAQSAASGDSGGSFNFNSSLPKFGEAGGDPGSDLSNEAIAIFVKDNVGEETMFKIKRTTQLGKVFNAYAERKGVDDGDLRFMLDGERVSYDDTPTILYLDDGDQIDVMMRQCGC